MKKILLAWLGHADINASQGDTVAGRGPILRALLSTNYTFASILVSSDLKTEGNAYSKWIKNLTQVPVKIHSTNLTDPTDITAIYKEVDIVIRTLQKKIEESYSLTFHLSPGTPYMAAVWMILSARMDAELIKSSKKHGVQTIDLPFNLSAKLIKGSGSTPDHDLFSSTEPVFIHGSKVMRKLVERIEIAAPLNIPVLVEGESGTGKELIANLIHRESLYREGPFVAINCGAIPSELAEAELFGYTKGAFTGADRDKPGYIEQAHGGTLFLDEIGELPLSIQVKLLRILQDKKVSRVGSISMPKEIHFRLIAATNRRLIEEVAHGRFREDLYYRIAVILIHSLPLRERKEEIDILAEHFINIINSELSIHDGYSRKKLSREAMAILKGYEWPGNIRELSNTLYRAAIWSPTSSIITNEDIVTSIEPVTNIKNDFDGFFHYPIEDGVDIRKIIGEVARHYMTLALKKSRGNMTQAAKLVSLSNHQTFKNWTEKYGIASDEK